MIGEQDNQAKFTFGKFIIKIRFPSITKTLSK